MFNINKSLISSNFYLKYFPLFSQFLFQAVTIFTILEFIRLQLPEIKLLQLIPGYYFFILVIFIISFFSIISIIVYFPSLFDSEKGLGSKNITKIQYFVVNKFLYFLVFASLFISINFILPGQFDNFYSYTEKTLENIWSFQELINLEVTLLILLFLVTQLPILVFYLLNINLKIISLPKSFKFFSFFVLLLSGFLTPTVDATSQIIFSLFTLILYLISIHFLIKRFNIKYLSLSNLD
jgi:Sec-independent protein secretion pathway component TatC